MEEIFYRWLVESVAGLILIGLGLSIFGQSVIYKSHGADWKKWFLWGTVSLIIFNSGVCVFGDAVKHRMLYESAQQKTGEK